MITQKLLNEMSRKYLNELKSKGRTFNPIRFELKSRKSSTVFGTAYLSYKRLGYDRITINKHLTDMEEFKNTLLHEIAHLDLEARGHGHSYEWKRVANMYSQWFNTNITTTSDKEIKVPGMVEVKVIWADKCLKINKNLPREYSRKYSGIGYAKNFVKKYQSIGFIESYKIVEVN